MFDPISSIVFALALIGLPPLLVQPLAKRRRRWGSVWQVSVFLFICVPCLGPVVLASIATSELNISPVRLWIVSIVALFISLRSWDIVRLPELRIDGWWRTTIFVLVWPTMCYESFLVPISNDENGRNRSRNRWRIVVLKLLSASIRIPIGLCLFALGAWLGCPDASWMLDHLLKLVEIYVFMGGMSDLLVATAAICGWKLKDVFRWPVLSKSVLDFWQRYSRHVYEWLHVHIFHAAGGRRHPFRAIILVFVFSSLIHEYVFWVALGCDGILGWQTAFFMLHGMGAIVGAMVTKRLGAVGYRIPRYAKIVITFCFIYFSTLLFMYCLDPLIPFHQGGIGTRLLDYWVGSD